MTNKKKCIFPKMGTKKNMGRKKSKNSMTPKERSKMVYKRVQEFRKWYGD
jgi:hypothetical protein